jgi:hypothetical protein
MVLQMGSFARRAARKDPIDHNKPISAAIFHGHSRVLQRLVSASKSASSSKSSPALDLTRHLMDHLLQLEHDFAAFALTEDSSLIQISGPETLTLDQERERERKRGQSRVMSGKRFVRVAATLVRCKASVGLVRSSSHTRFETAESLQTPLHYAVTTVVANATTVAAARPRYAGFADRFAESTTLQLTRGLLCAKADVNLCDGYGCTPLHRAVSHGAFSHVSLLLQASANIDVFNNGGYTPLHLACYSGHSGHAGHVANASGKVELLLRSSASVHALNHRNQTALCLVLAAPGLLEADIAMDMAIVKALADYKASVDVGRVDHVEGLSWSPREYLAVIMHSPAASECTDHGVDAFEVHTFAAKLFGVVESDSALDIQRGLHHLLQLGSQLDLGRELDKDTRDE